MSKKVIHGLILFSCLVSILFFRAAYESFAVGRWKNTESFLPPPVPSPALMKVLSGGQPGAVSMMVWLRVLPYLGDLMIKKHMEKVNWDFIASAIENVTSLDEFFYDAYFLAANALPMKGKYLDTSLKIVEKGVRILNNRWDLPFFLGFNYQYYAHDHDKARYFIYVAGSRPGAPAYVKDMVAYHFYERGLYREGIMYLSRIQNDKNTPEFFREVLRKKTDLLKNLLYLQEGLDRYREENKTLPGSIQELLKKGYITRIPDEPFGGSYFIDYYRGKVRSTSIE